MADKPKRKPGGKPFTSGSDPRRWKHGGTSKAKLAQSREMLGPYVKEAVETIIDAMRNANQYQTKLAAAEKILTRMWGRPPDKVAMTDAEGNDLPPTDARAEIARMLHSIVARTGEKKVPGGTE